MSQGSLARTKTEHYRDAWTQYQEVYPGSFSAEKFVDWALQKRLIDIPKLNPKRMLVRDAKRAMRSFKFTDAQGRRNVREMIAARVPRVDSKGNRVFEVIWDHIHRMSKDHALTAFEQQDHNITRQRKAATRNMESFLANNPNAGGVESQFVFDFMLHEPVEEEVDVIPETATNSQGSCAIDDSPHPKKPR